MAKTQSKRISTRKREKINKKIKEHHRKVRKESRTRKRLPKSILQTQEEKDQINQIKVDTEERTRNFVGERESKPRYIVELEKYIDSDIFVQIVDYRDISGSRSFAAEEYLRSAGKEIQVYLSFVQDLGVDLAAISEFTRFEETASLAGKKICIFGNRKSGKFLLAKLIEENSSDTTVARVTTPQHTRSVADVLRGVYDIDKIDGIFGFKEIFGMLDANALKDHYQLPDFDNEDEFLRLMGTKFSKEKRPRKTMEAGALVVLNDIRNGKILWSKENGVYRFIYL